MPFLTVIRPDAEASLAWAKTKDAPELQALIDSEEERCKKHDSRLMRANVFLAFAVVASILFISTGWYHRQAVSGLMLALILGVIIYAARAFGLYDRERTITATARYALDIQKAMCPSTVAESK